MNKEAIKVVVRVRPFLERQLQAKFTTSVTIDPQEKQISVLRNKQEDTLRIFTFDRVFGPKTHQLEIYQSTAFQLVQSVLQGFNATVLAYGQTGSGKTHTMIGRKEEEGVIPRAFEQIVSGIQTKRDRAFLVQCSFLQIYKQNIRDLLSDSKQKLQILQSPDSGVYVKGARKIHVKSLSQLKRILSMGLFQRVSAETSMNTESSRSHAVFTLHLQSSECQDQIRKKFRVAKLNLVDLAGSQRVGKLNAGREQFNQGIKINLSLGALGNVISALIDKKAKFVPYRDSKLTRLLMDSLGGNTKTLIVSTISPGEQFYEETICTLRFSSKAQLIKNSPVINEDKKDALLRKYEQEIKRLRQLLDRGKNEQPSIIQDISVIQRNIIKGGEHIEGAISPQEYFELKEKVQKHKAERLRIEADKKVKEEKLLYMQNNYITLQEQVNEMREMLKQLRVKYRVAAQEVIDLQNDNYAQKQSLLEAVRNLQRQNQIYKNAISKLVTSQQMKQISELVDSMTIRPQKPDKPKVPFASTKNQNFFKIRNYGSTEKIMNRTGSNFRSKRK